MKRITLIAFCVAMIAAVSCGNNSQKKTSGQDAVQNPAEVTESAQAEAPVARTEEPKADARKWYQQDFSLTERMYVSGAGTSRVYARKGNVLIFKMEGSQTTNLFVCTDSTRTGYLVNEGALTYVKKSEKSDFDSVDDAIYNYLQSSMSNTIFGERMKKSGKGVSVKDTTIFGRPAYVLTQEKTEDIVDVQMYTKVIEWVDKENGLPYYKYGLSKKDGAPYMEGKAFEVTSFSAEPTYEGLIMSLDGLTEIAK